MEGWFAQLERRSLYRGVFTSVTELKREIERVIKIHSKELAKPSRWTKDAPTILGALKKRILIFSQEGICRAFEMVNRQERRWGHCFAKK